jgi:TolB-like protein
LLANRTVNIAARLEGVAKPGAICLSEQAYWQVKGRLDLKVTDLGATQLKNIAEPIRVYSLEVGPPAQAKATPSTSTAAAPPKSRTVWSRWPALAAALAVALLAAAGYAWHAGYAPRQLGVPAADDKLVNAPRLSIVVLPFQNLSGDKEQDYFADGITDDLTTDLSHLPDSFVISRGTAFTYKDKPVDAKEVGRELGVRYLLEGSVRRLSDKVEVNAQLISTETGAHVWADRFDGDRSKLGELQVEVVARLARSLGIELIRAEALRAGRERPNNQNAVDLAMQGWASLNSGFNKANFDAAIGYFERALQFDPQLVRAQVGLAWALIDRVFVFGSGDAAVDYPRAEALLTSALSKEPNYAWAHFVKAILASDRKQFSDALSEVDVAIENDPNFAAAYAFRGVNRIFVGQAAEAIPDVETAFRLSPRDPFRSVWESHMCHAYAHLGQWEKVVEWCQKAVATNPAYWFPYIDLVAANGWLGHDAEAKAAIDGLHKQRPGYTVQSAASFHPTDDPTFNAQYQRIVDGLRKAGLPEGVAKTN